MWSFSNNNLFCVEQEVLVIFFASFILLFRNEKKDSSVSWFCMYKNIKWCQIIIYEPIQCEGRLSVIENRVWNDSEYFSCFVPKMDWEILDFVVVQIQWLTQSTQQSRYASIHFMCRLKEFLCCFFLSSTPSMSNTHFYGSKMKRKIKLTLQRIYTHSLVHNDHIITAPTKNSI